MISKANQNKNTSAKQSFEGVEGAYVAGAICGSM
jgi:hypothetical protein